MLEVSMELPSVNEWQARNVGSLPFPAEKLGGYGNSNLELKCIYLPNWNPDLINKAKKKCWQCENDVTSN